MRLISGTTKSTPTYWLPVLCNVLLPNFRTNEALQREFMKIEAKPKLPIQDELPQLRCTRLISRKPPIRTVEQLQNNNYDYKTVESCWEPKDK